MRRYSRYKICKTNFHYFFNNSRILQFNRPKWNLCKEKFLLSKKKNYTKASILSFNLKYLFNMSLVFKSNKNYGLFTSKLLASSLVSFGIRQNLACLNTLSFSDYDFFNQYRN